VAPPLYTVKFFRVKGVVGRHEVFVPPYKSWVLRNIDCYGSMDALGGGNILISSISEDVSFIYFEWLALERSSKSWEGRQAITYDDAVGGLRIDNFTSYPVDVSITGYELDDPEAAPPIIP